MGTQKFGRNIRSKKERERGTGRREREIKQRGEKEGQRRKEEERRGEKRREGKKERERKRDGSYRWSDFELRTFIEFLISSFRSRER